VDQAGWIGVGASISINTELRVAWRRGLEEGLSKEPDEVVPYKILPFAVKSVEEVARSQLSLFNAVGKALH
jgi:fructose-bisphosphate aldolase, class II